MSNPLGFVTTSSPYRSGRAPGAEPTTVPRLAAFRVHATCPHCARPVPINAPVTEARCGACNNIVEVAAKVLASLCDSFESSHESLQGWWRDFSTANVTGKLSHGTDEEREGLVPHPAPPWLRELSPTAETVWLPDSPNSKERPNRLSFACPECETALRVDATTERTLSCHGCHAAVWIPEGLWEQFHPVPLIETWLVEFRGENEWDRETRLEGERKALQRERERKAAQRKRDEEQRAKQERAADVVVLERRARNWTWIHFVFTGAAIAWPWLVYAGVGAGTWPHLTTAALIASTFVLQCVALAVCGTAIARATDRRDHTFLLWFELAFVWTMPIIGHLIGFDRVWGLLWGDDRRELGSVTRWGGYNWLIIVLGGLALIASTLTAYLI